MIPKRAFDVLVAGAALAVLGIPMLVVALAIKLTSRGPVLFVDPRAGRHGRPFGMLKFRTMVVGAAGMGLGREVAADDERITGMGRFLRQWTLDELPQIINVLKGDMSVVGPRPASPDQMERCSARQRRRLDVRPGMAGHAWINGRNSIPWSERIEHDLWYVENRSFLLDLRILMRAFVVAIKREGIYGPDGVARDLDWRPKDEKEGAL